MRVNLSIGTLDEATWKATEPGTPHARQRVEAVRKLRQAGIETGVLIAPILKEHWMAWLQQHRPDLVPLYRRRYARSTRLPRADQESISALVQRIAAEAAIDTADGYLAASPASNVSAPAAQPRPRRRGRPPSR